ncbi:MAG TPA: hypothetical protein PKN44_03255 [Bacteroidales bacterium]|nr:hypothetical protein [Bacteroidales bacterium]HPS49252.1 hypothetical protein [Bacteroidales bacterium]
MGSIKELPDVFVGKGEVRNFHFKKIAEKPAGFLYRVTSSELIHYEVFKRKVNKRFNCVSYPSSNRFGIDAWTTRDLSEARQRFDQL